VIRILILERSLEMIRENIKNMEAYKPPLEGRASGGYLLLDFNEMTVEPSPKVKQALKDFVDLGRLQVYPEYGDVDAKVAQYAGVRPEEVMLTNGSDQGIDVIFRAFVGSDDKVIIPAPSFAMFYQSAELQGAEILEPIYREDLTFPLKEVLSLIDERVKLIVVCNPNNPTGTAISREDFLKILQKARDYDVAVLHDEAYFEWCGITAKYLIADFDNLFITRTLSKQFGIASLRAGYVLSQEQNVKELLKIRGPYDINMFAKVAIEAALDDVGYMKNYVKEVMEKSKPKLEQFFRENNVKF
jgi:histidinol-phosphate aminotransferase